MISRDELCEVMGQIDEDLWKAILEECGNASNDHITQEQFLKILINV